MWIYSFKDKRSPHELRIDTEATKTANGFRQFRNDLNFSSTANLRELSSPLSSEMRKGKIPGFIINLKYLVSLSLQ